MTYTISVAGVSVQCDTAAGALELVRLMVPPDVNGQLPIDDGNSGNNGNHSTDAPEPRVTRSARVGSPKPEDWAQARTWWMEGMFVREMAERLGVTESAIYYQQRTRHWPERPAKQGVKPFSGKQQPPKESKLTPAEWDLVRVRYVSGQEPLREIARQLGITHQTILAHAEQEGWPPRALDHTRGRSGNAPFPPPSGRPVKTRTCDNCGVGTAFDMPCVKCGAEVAA